MQTEPITHGGKNRGYKPCKCAKCQTIAECTPDFDFYTLADDDNGLLYCEICFWRMIRNNLT